MLEVEIAASGTYAVVMKVRKEWNIHVCIGASKVPAAAMVVTGSGSTCTLIRMAYARGTVCERILL